VVRPDPPPPDRPAPKDWESMDTAPTDGKTIWLRSAADEHGKFEEVLGIFRRSRAFDTKMVMWVPKEWWAYQNAGGMKIPWEPVGWRPRMGIF
jgi:hypothetical protein